MIRFVKKNINSSIPKAKREIPEAVQKKEEPVQVEKPKKNKRSRKPKVMNEEKMNRAETIANNLMQDGHVKIVKKDRGLIERTESSKVILTEDNRQVLGD